MIGEVYNMESTIKIGFAGSYKCDLLLYLARIATAAGKRVAIVDAASEDIWSYSVPVYMDKKLVTYNDTDIYLSCNTKGSLGDVDLGKYDMVFFDFGFNKDMVEYASQCDAGILISDIERNHVLRLREYIKAFTLALESEDKPKMDVIKIYRDVVDSKINTKYTDTLLDIGDKLNIAMEYIVGFDSVDYRCRIESQYNDNIKFNKITKDLKSMFVDILESCTQIDRKSLLNAMKKAERGN